MDFLNDYRSLRFEERIPGFFIQIAVLGVVFVGFTGCWLLIPHSALYWLCLPSLGAMTWLATCGWRAALFDLMTFLKWLEQLEI